MVKSLACGCTLDSDFVSEEHNEKAPHHVKLKPDAPALAAEPNEFEAEAKRQEDAAADEPEEKHKKKHW